MRYGTGAISCILSGCFAIRRLGGVGAGGSFGMISTRSAREKWGLWENRMIPFSQIYWQNSCSAGNSFFPAVFDYFNISGRRGRRGSRKIREV